VTVAGAAGAGAAAGAGGAGGAGGVCAIAPHDIAMMAPASPNPPTRVLHIAISPSNFTFDMFGQRFDLDMRSICYASKSQLCGCLATPKTLFRPGPLWPTRRVKMAADLVSMAFFVLAVGAHPRGRLSYRQ
jgi:hypothetical protein